MNPETRLSRRTLLARTVYISGGLLAAATFGCRKENSLIEHPEEYSASLTSLVNETRLQRNLNQLEEHPLLKSAASRYAKQLADINFPNSPPGSSAPSLRDRLGEAGIHPAPGMPSGEIVVAGSKSSPDEIVKEILEKEESGEFEGIMLEPLYKYVGIGCSAKDYRIWCVQYYVGELVDVSTLLLK